MALQLYGGGAISRVNSETLVYKVDGVTRMRGKLVWRCFGRQGGLCLHCTGLQRFLGSCAWLKSGE